MWKDKGVCVLTVKGRIMSVYSWNPSNCVNQGMEIWQGLHFSQKGLKPWETACGHGAEVSRLHETGAMGRLIIVVQVPDQFNEGRNQ